MKRCIRRAMTNPNARRFECEQHHAGLTVSDISTAVDFYTGKLGFWLAFTWGDPPTFAGVNLGDVQIFLQHGTPSPQGCSVYFVVGDADELYEFQRANGVEVVEPPADMPLVTARLHGSRSRPLLPHLRPPPAEHAASSSHRAGRRSDTSRETPQRISRLVRIP